jgi:hypothetical protein
VVGVEDGREEECGGEVAVAREDAQRWHGELTICCCRLGGGGWLFPEFGNSTDEDVDR